MMEGSIPSGFPGGPSFTCLMCSFPPPTPAAEDVVGGACPGAVVAVEDPNTEPAIVVVTGWLVGTVTVGAGVLVVPAWAADIACLTGKGSSPLEDIVTLGAAETAREVAEADRIREEEEEVEFCCCI